MPKQTVNVVPMFDGEDLPDQEQTFTFSEFDLNNTDLDAELGFMVGEALRRSYTSLVESGLEVELSELSVRIEFWG